MNMQAISAMRRMFSRTVVMSGVMGFALAGCAMQGSSTGKGASGESAMLQAYQRYVDGWNSRTPAKVMSPMSADATYTSPGAGEKLSPQQFNGYLQAFFGGVPDFHVDIVKSGPVDSDTLADEWVVTGTWTKPFVAGPLAGLAPTGKSFRLPGVGFHDFKDGKIVSTIHYYDNLSLLTQLGVIQPK